MRIILDKHLQFHSPFWSMPGYDKGCLSQWHAEVKFQGCYKGVRELIQGVGCYLWRTGRVGRKIKSVVRLYNSRTRKNGKTRRILKILSKCQLLFLRVLVKCWMKYWTCLILFGDFFMEYWGCSTRRYFWTFFLRVSTRCWWLQWWEGCSERGSTKVTTKVSTKWLNFWHLIWSRKPR